VIIPFCPPDVEKVGRKNGELLGDKIDSGRIRNPVQKTPIMNIIGDNFLWLDQIREIEANPQLTKPLLTSTCLRVTKLLSSRLILDKDAGQKNPWFDYFHKVNPILIIFMDVVETEQGLKIVVIILVCEQDDGSWIEAKMKAPKMFCYARWSILMSRKHRNNFSKAHASTFNDRNTILLVSRKMHVKNILFKFISKVKKQPHVDKPPRTPLGYLLGSWLTS
jgi:hypothetical protein